MTREVSALKVGENLPTSEPCVKAPLISCLLPAPCGENKAGKSSVFVNLSFEGAAEASRVCTAKDSQGLCMAGDDLLRLESGSPPSLS